MPRLLFGFFLAAALATCAAAVSNRAEGAFPGLNGKIAFTSNRDGNQEIYVMNPDGSGQVNVSNSPAVDREPAWSSDGRQIAFSSDRDGNREIYRMNADGTSQTRVTYNDAVDRWPAWTNDGRILFDRQASLSPTCATGVDVYRINANGSGEINLLSNSSAEDCTPAGSAGGRIAFSSTRDGNFEIYSANVDGGEVTRITSNPDFEYRPNWSPDSSRIAYLFDDTGVDNEIYVMNANGSGQTRLTFTPSRVEDDVAWSPAGDKLVFQACLDFPNCTNFQIYAMNSGGGGEVQLTSLGSNSNPDWAPFVPPPPPPPPPPPDCEEDDDDDDCEDD